MFSIVIPLYNKQKYIAQALQSVFNQTFSEFEVIVVNDGSTDGSLQVLTGFKDSRLKVVSTKNQGVSVARNTGINTAVYQWIAFLDADDWWETSFLSEMFAAIKSFPNQRLFASGRSRVFLSHTERYSHLLLPGDGMTEAMSYFPVIASNSPLLNSSNTVLKKEILEEKGFFTSNQKRHEDHDLWLRLAVNESVVFVNKNLSYYRKTDPNSASKGTYDANDFLMYLTTLENIKKQLNRRDLEPFNKYCNRFVLITYIKYYGSFTIQEDRMVYEAARKLVDGRSGFLLKFLRLLPFKNTYSLFKIFQKR